MDVLTEVKKTKKSRKKIVDKCYSCGSHDLISIDTYEREFDDVQIDNKGVVCSKCNCFHYIDGDGDLTYEYNYNDYDDGDKIEWTISDN